MTRPLDPLSAAEISQAVDSFCSQHGSTEAFFSSIGLVEPPKGKVKAGASVPRVRAEVDQPKPEARERQDEQRDDDVAATAFWYQTLPTAPFPPLPDRARLTVD